MKSLASAMALAMLAASTQAHHGHGHGNVFALRANATASVCVPTCTTIWTTITGAPTLLAMTTTTSTKVNTKTVTVIKSAAPVLPTPVTSVLPTPGTYSMPATTVTVERETTVCGVASTRLTPGIHTLGGLTTVVEASQVVTCPVATLVTSGSITTSTIVQTQYVCPSAGTYTIGPVTTSLGQETDVLYPTPLSYQPGTYTAPATVVVATVNSYVYYCPLTSSRLLPSTSASVPAPVPLSSSVAVVSNPPLPPVPSSPAPPVSNPPPAPVSMSSVVVLPPSASSSQPSTSRPSPNPSGKIGSSNDHFGITYTPYEPSNGQCKPADQVARDIAQLKNAGFTTVRVYSTDCQTLDHVGSACREHGLDMIVGVFVKDSCDAESPDIKEQIKQLAAWDSWHLVKLLVVGNEAIMNGRCSPQQLFSLINAVKSQCSKYTGPYTIAETLNIWQRPDVSSVLCGAVDVTGANIHPFFNGKVTPETAGDFVAQQLDLLAGICRGNDVINLECGWPTRGNCNGSACPGQEQQAQAISSIRQKTGSKTVFFSYEDDLWKPQSDCACERSWGAAAAFSYAVAQ
ncbi:hypothetical protein CDD82_2102 [Ophiocordyceps australis]|uniref:Probable beta-glucosidase btgE n=1 Tax=Ophiocordyceps australis TaxID=1399860 RepID=A0A2C5Y4F7_9HYPO|nr:hypothetical protein CDD82_2102 [Ophiocordyceps australis]